MSFEYKKLNFCAHWTFQQRKDEYSVGIFASLSAINTTLWCVVFVFNDFATIPWKRTVMAEYDENFGQTMRTPLVVSFTLRSKLCQSTRYRKFIFQVLYFLSSFWKSIKEILFSFAFFFQCFGHSWYLSVDMQLFFIAPLLVYLISFFKGKALFTMSFAVLGCVGGTLYVYISNDLTGL